MIRRAKYQLTKFVVLVCLAALAAHGLVNVEAQDQTVRTPFNYGEPLTARLSKGESHLYPLILAVGQYAEVEAKALSGNITLELTAPDGKRIMSLKILNGDPVGNSVRTVAVEPATYFVKITAAGPPKDGVVYQAQMSEPRMADNADKARCQGEYLFADGEAMNAQGEREGRLAAIEKFRRALPFYEEAGDWFGAARAVNMTGQAWYGLSNYQEALSSFDKAFLLAQKAGQTTKSLSLKAKIANNIGVIADRQYEMQKALFYYLQAITASRQMNDRRTEAIYSMNIGNVYTSTGQPEEAWHWYEQSLSIHKELQNDEWVAAVLDARGVAKFHQRQYLQAIEDQKASLEIWRKLADPGGQGWTLTILAANYIEMQQPQTALELLNDALPLIIKGGSRSDEAFALHRLGDGYRLLGQLDKAIEYYQRALDTRQTWKTNEPIMDAFSISWISRTEILRGNLAEAVSQSNRALTIVDQVRRQYSSPLLGASYSSSTHHYYDEHIALLLKLHAREPAAGYDKLAFQTSERAHARALLENLSSAGNNPRTGLPAELTEREASLQKEIDRVSSERDKVERTTSSAAKEARKRELDNELRHLMAQMDQLQGEIRASNPIIAALLRPQPLSLAEIQRQLLSPDCLLLEYFVAQDRLYLFALTSESDHALQVVEISDKAAIEKAAEFFQRKKFETDDELLRRFSYQNREFTKTVQFLSGKLLAPVKPLLQKRKIWIVSDGALQRIPFAALPDPRKTSAATSTSPGRGAARRAPLTPLLVEHEIATMPSASTVAWLRKVVATRPPATRGIAAIADPVFSANDKRMKNAAPRPEPQPATIAQLLKPPDIERALRDLEGVADDGALIRLPASRFEAQAIAGLAPEISRVAVDFDANRQMVMNGELSDYRYLHFGTHADVHPVFPGLSWLALSQVDRKGQEQPGYLRLNDIYQLRLNADLVTLGACRTGLGKQLRGEGMIGLGRGFFYAGVPRVMVSLWDVPDRETAHLMQSFYHKLLKQKLPFSEALRQAQVEMWERAESSAPFFWAAFSLQGDPE